MIQQTLKGINEKEKKECFEKFYRVKGEGRETIHIKGSSTVKSIKDTFEQKFDKMVITIKKEKGKPIYKISHAGRWVTDWVKGSPTKRFTYADTILIMGKLKYS